MKVNQKCAAISASFERIEINGVIEIVPLIEPIYVPEGDFETRFQWLSEQRRCRASVWRDREPFRYVIGAEGAWPPEQVIFYTPAKFAWSELDPMVRIIAGRLIDGERPKLRAKTYTSLKRKLTLRKSDLVDLASRFAEFEALVGHGEAMMQVVEGKQRSQLFVHVAEPVRVTLAHMFFDKMKPWHHTHDRDAMFSDDPTP